MITEEFSLKKTFRFWLFGSCVTKDLQESQAEVKPEPFICCLQEQAVGLLPVFNGNQMELPSLPDLLWGKIINLYQVLSPL